MFIERFLMVAAIGAASRVTDSAWVDILYVVTLLNLTGWFGLGIRQAIDERFPMADTFGKLHRFSQSLRLVLTVLGILVASLTANHVIIEAVDEFIEAAR